MTVSYCHMKQYVFWQFFPLTVFSDIRFLINVPKHTSSKSKPIIFIIPTAIVYFKYGHIVFSSFKYFHVLTNLIYSILTCSKSNERKTRFRFVLDAIFLIYLININSIMFFFSFSSSFSLRGLFFLMSRIKKGKKNTVSELFSWVK